MLLRLVLALGGVSFLAAGIGIFFTDSCNSITWGSRGSERAGSFTATRRDVFVDDGMSRGAAGIMAMAAGLLLVLTVSASPLHSCVAGVFAASSRARDCSSDPRSR
jgi:hypothetical protein